MDTATSISRLIGRTCHRRLPPLIWSLKNFFMKNEMIQDINIHTALNMISMDIVKTFPNILFKQQPPNLNS
ncbi:MAG TPA: hypothetical protein DD429_11770 [Clostridiaceae bacterium]|nr:hypothetical protein [Clostridiaceae bacterium]